LSAHIKECVLSFRSIFILIRSSPLLLLAVWSFSQPGCAFGQVPDTSAATLSLLDAARYSLLNSPQLHLQQQQVEIFRGQAQQAAGLFDWVLSANYQQGFTNDPLTYLQQLTALQSGITTINQGTNLATYSASGQELFRNGIEISPVVQGTRTLDNLSNYSGTNRSVTDLDISIPLLRNRGTEVVDAQERAARLQVNAGEFDLRQTMTDLLAGVASAYWQYVAALANLEVARGSEDRGRLIVKNMQELINADHEPKSEINEANANLSDRVANRILAEQQVVQAQQSLAVGMGLSVNELTHVGAPADGFPPGEQMPKMAGDTDTVQKFIQEAFQRRADIKADQTRISAARAQQVAAVNQLKPQLNLTVTAGTSGLAEGSSALRLIESPVHSVRGLDLTGGISFSINPANNTAKGEVVQANATIRQAQIAETQARLSVASAVVVALNGLRNAQASLGEANLSVQAFRQSLDDQREKLRLSIGSVVDILTIEDRLTASLTTQVQAELNFALALTQLRQATGTIVAANQTNMTVDRDVFFTVPLVEGRP
jgi:outer membrane protein TolC